MMAWLYTKLLVEMTISICDILGMMNLLYNMQKKKCQAAENIMDGCYQMPF
jgi:hypothetical protein